MIKATLSENNSLLKEWEQPCHTDLPALLEAAKLIKQSVNDYLTCLISQSMGSVSSDLMELTENSDAEEDTKEYNLSELIGKTEEQEKKETFLNRRKKLKK